MWINRTYAASMPQSAYLWCSRMALFKLEEYESAKAAFEKAQSLDSKNSSIKTWIRKCIAELDGELRHSYCLHCCLLSSCLCPKHFSFMHCCYSCLQPGHHHSGTHIYSMTALKKLGACKQMKRLRIPHQVPKRTSHPQQTECHLLQQQVGLLLLQQ